MTQQSEIKDDSKEMRKVFCRNCKRATNHKILLRNEKRESTVNDEIWTINTFYTLQCQGCETICLLEEYIFSEDYNPETGDLDVSTYIYPSPFENKSAIEDIHYLPKIVSKIYKECISAFNRKLPILTSIGMRATVEAICKDKQINSGNLEQKIDKLADMGLMTRQEAELLHLNRYMGNAAAHELLEPLQDELTTGLDIIEATLRNAYILPEKAELLKNKYTKKVIDNE